jgi:hypothetical protein
MVIKEEYPLGNNTTVAWVTTNGQM